MMGLCIGYQQGRKQMTTAMKEAIARMQTGRIARNAQVYQIPNGTWRHRYSQVEWLDRSGAEMDFRFTVESDFATYR
jgi:hypothetical protein